VFSEFGKLGMLCECVITNATLHLRRSVLVGTDLWMTGDLWGPLLVCLLLSM
jgi:hypothetical protein